MARPWVKVWGERLRGSRRYRRCRESARLLFHELLSLADSKGRVYAFEEKGEEVPFSLRELADEALLPWTTFRRALASLEDVGLVERDGKVLVLPRFDRLAGEAPRTVRELVEKTVENHRAPGVMGRNLGRNLGPGGPPSGPRGRGRNRGL